MVPISHRSLEDYMNERTWEHMRHWEQTLVGQTSVSQYLILKSSVFELSDKHPDFACLLYLHVFPTKEQIYSKHHKIHQKSRLS
jgi:hypothetical protein